MQVFLRCTDAILIPSKFKHRIAGSFVSEKLPVYHGNDTKIHSPECTAYRFSFSLTFHLWV